MNYEEYPKVLRHPGETAAVVSQWDSLQRRHVPEHGSPARFQPVTVNSRDQEEEYEAKGYRAAGTPDPAAYQKAKLSPETTSYAFQEYPKWVGDTLVKSRAEEDALVGVEERMAAPTTDEENDVGMKPRRGRPPKNQA